MYPNTSAITTDWRLDGVKASIAKEKQLLLALLAASRQAAHGGEGLQRPSRSPLLYSEAEALLLSLATELYLPFQYISVKNIMYVLRLGEYENFFHLPKGRQFCFTFFER